MGRELDLSFLSDAEYEKIKEVLNRDNEIQKREEARIRRLKNKAARTNNPIILKKICMRTGDWFWEVAEKQGTIRRNDTATSSLRASLRAYNRKGQSSTKSQKQLPIIEVHEPYQDDKRQYNTVKVTQQKGSYSPQKHPPRKLDSHENGENNTSLHSGNEDSVKVSSEKHDMIDEKLAEKPFIVLTDTSSDDKYTEPMKELADVAAQPATELNDDSVKVSSEKHDRMDEKLAEKPFIVLTDTSSSDKYTEPMKESADVAAQPATELNDDVEDIHSLKSVPVHPKISPPEEKKVMENETKIPSEPEMPYEPKLSSEPEIPSELEMPSEPKLPSEPGLSSKEEAEDFSSVNEDASANVAVDENIDPSTDNKEPDEITDEMQEDYSVLTSSNNAAVNETGTSKASSLQAPPILITSADVDDEKHTALSATELMQSTVEESKQSDEFALDEQISDDSLMQGDKAKDMPVAGFDNPNNKQDALKADTLSEGSDKVQELSSSLNFLQRIDHANMKETGSRHGSLGSSAPNLSLSPMRKLGLSSWSVHSTVSGAVRSNMEITGTIEFSLSYSHVKKCLSVKIKGCSDLAAAEKKKLSNPYVKTYLLPDKHSKRKTKAKNKTLNPVFNETLKYDITAGELNTRTLNVAVWHDKFGVNVFLGEVNINMDGFDGSSNGEMKVYHLQGKDEFGYDGFDGYLGEVELALRLNCAGSAYMSSGEDQLEIVLKNLKNISPSKVKETPNLYVKSYFLPDKEHATKQKTPIISGRAKIDFDHLFMYTNVQVKDLEQRCIELTVWQSEKFASNQLVGGVRIGPGTGLSFNKPVLWMDSTPDEIALWKKMRRQLGTWVEGQLNLRTFDPAK